MADINLTLDPKFEGKSQDEVLAVFDQEVERFSAFMAGVGDWRAKGALNNPEKALLKTYLVQKHRGRLNG